MLGRNDQLSAYKSYPKKESLNESSTESRCNPTATITFWLASGYAVEHRSIASTGA
jgi:hypothetical protein